MDPKQVGTGAVAVITGALLAIGAVGVSSSSASRRECIRSCIGSQPAPADTPSVPRQRPPVCEHLDGGSAGLTRFCARFERDGG